MKTRTRWQYLRRTPQLLWDIFLRGRYDFRYDLMPIHVEGMSNKKRANLLVSGMNLAYRRTRPWSWPIHMQAELVNYCNLSCPVCPTGAGVLARERGNLDLDMYERLMAEVGPYLLTVSLWGWGEPLLHPDFPEAVRITRQHGVVPILSTNGQPFGQERVLEGLLREPPTYLIVAIDGLTEETNSVYRVGASLERILVGVRRLRQERDRRGQKLPLMNMRFISMKHNQHEFSRARSFAVKNGFDFLTRRTLSIKHKLDGAVHGDLVPDEDDDKAYRYTGKERLRRDDFICQMAFSFPSVRVDGTIVSCDQDYNGDQPYGKFGKDGSFADIWRGKPARAVRKTIRNNRHSFATCRSCPFADRLTNSSTVEIIDLRD